MPGQGCERESIVPAIVQGMSARPHTRRPFLSRAGRSPGSARFLLLARVWLHPDSFRRATVRRQGSPRMGLGAHRDTGTAGAFRLHQRSPIVRISGFPSHHRPLISAGLFTSMRDPAGISFHPGILLAKGISFVAVSRWCVCTPHTGRLQVHYPLIPEGTGKPAFRTSDAYGANSLVETARDTSNSMMSGGVSRPIGYRPRALTSSFRQRGRCI